MIGKLTGRIDHRGDDHVLIDVGGVGYLVFCSDRTLAALPGAGQVAALYTDLLVREDVLQLYGFLTLYDREWHRLLVGVQGIGARGSLAILGALGTDGIAGAVATGDWVAVRAAPGVGPKIAQRVVHELRDKAPAVMALAGRAAPAAPAADAAPSPAAAPAAATPPAPGQAAAAQAEALSALQNLGYAPAEAAAAAAQSAAEAPEADTAALIRAALRRLGAGE